MSFKEISHLIKRGFKFVFGKLLLAAKHIRPMAIWHWLCGIYKALVNLWHSIANKWFRRLIIAILIFSFAFHKIADFTKPNLTQENIYTVHYLNDGWTETERENFYYTPQGTELLNLNYDWLINLELPFSHELMATEENMRGWGFIVEPGQRPSELNPGNLPVGLGLHVNPETKEKKLDIGCAACHTGELHYKGVALRVDGGQAVQSIANTKRGEFIPTLGAAVFETLLNPSKWDRFADRVAGHDKEKRKELKKGLWAYANKLRAFAKGPGASKLHPVEEGRGRTDAVGRIANTVFGYDLKVPENYKVADAPASYPFLWDIWRFDWVQYTGFTNQAMARNVGETLGVLAPITLVSEKDSEKLASSKKFAKTQININGLHCVEGMLRNLKPPKWPEDILGKIDIEKAQKGKQLFSDHCQQCHGPHITDPYDWAVATKESPKIAGQTEVNWKWDMAGEISDKDGQAYRKDWREKIWAVPWISTKEIGTDPQLVNNYLDNRYDASKLIPGSEPVSAGEGLQLLLNRIVPLIYEHRDIPDSEIASFDGLNVPFRIENKRAYKARPLHGVWATPPFLHNGSVPTVYHLLSPQRERPNIFYVGNREYNPLLLGYEVKESIGSFRHDTSIKGNHNTGHLFTDLDSPGRIGPRFKEYERYAILEYLKVMGNPEFDTQLEGDPQNWQQYTLPPSDKWNNQACRKAHSRRGVFSTLAKK